MKVLGPAGKKKEWFTRIGDFAEWGKLPACHVYRTSSQTISNDTETDLLFTSNDHDTASMHDTSNNTDRITIPMDGVYCFGAHVLWNANATGYRQVIVSLNDSAPVANVASLVEEAINANVFPSNFARNQRAGTRRLSKGDVLRCVVKQNSGGDLTVLDTTTYGPRGNGFWAFWVSP